ncbi:hypothetical protein SAMN05444166_0864 [Singulisphaera sp. GP187]|uniref:hypothetical protein n=1 Tax=Singulisphaera sp. GP187 TaxID=1882752 RepID=UPI00092A5AC1|nr:hypothetical protein [Singulisphaera sp. GP187]SIN78911.1 hypothetical protein SAMN05444166_0864 [Singulisphaera sp. GP187]
MVKLHSNMARWSVLTLVMMLVAAASASLSGCGDSAEKTAPQTEYPAAQKAGDQAQIDFMKTQGKPKRK